MNRIIRIKDEIEKNNKYQFILIAFFILCISFLFSTQYEMFIYNNGVSSTDSSVFRTIAMQMKNGLMPYRNTFDHKGPILYLINYFALCISDKYGIWLIEVLSIFITFVFMYKTANLFNNKFKSLLIILISIRYLFIYYDGGNLVEEYALPFMLISLYIFIDYLKNNNINIFRLLVCGTSFGIVLLLRPNMISLWIAYCIGVLIKNINDKTIKNIVKFIIWFLIGAAIIIVPIVIWLYLNDAFNDFVFDYLTFNFMYSTNTDKSNLIDRIKCFICFFCTFSMIIAILSSVLNIKKEKILNISFIIYYLVSIYCITASGHLFSHYGIVLIPLITYGYSILFKMVEDSDYIKVSYKYLIIGLLIGLEVLSPWTDLCKQFLMNSINYYGSIKNDTQQIDIDSIYYSIEKYTDEDDVISVYGNKNIYYIKSNRMPASKFSYQFPIGEINEEIFKEYFDDLEKTQPKFVVIAIKMDDKMISFLEDNNYFEYRKYDGDILYTNIKELKEN